MELRVEQGANPTASRDWLKTLSQLGIQGVRIGGNASGRPEVRNTGTAERPAFHVTGVIGRDGRLTLPGGRFRSSEGTAIARWIAGLAAAAQPESEKKNVFGLTASQYETLRKDLAQKVEGSTKGKSIRDVANAIARQLKHPVAVAPAAREALDPKLLVREELQGVSCGTALAIALRPAGVMMQPNGSSGRAIVAVMPAVAGAQPWPVGWPVPTGKQQRELVPPLFDFLDYEVAAVPLEELLEAIGTKLAVPLVYDQNSMALEGIDPAGVTLTLGSGKTYYGRVLAQGLSKARLKYEVRVDEAGHPLIWITTLKPH